MYSQSHRHIHLLSDQEVEDIYAAPQFNNAERTLYFWFCRKKIVPGLDSEFLQGNDQRC
jgi:hypothetical protein